MKLRKLFLFFLLMGIFSVSIFSIAIADDKIQCIHCGQWAIPGQHDDCPKLQELKKEAEDAKKEAEEAQKKAEEAQKELERLKKEKEQEDEQDDVKDALDLVGPVTSIIGLVNTVIDGIDEATGYICSQCNTLQYGSHICVPETCSICGAVGSHQCPGPVINLDNEPLSIKQHTCPKCGVTWSGSHTCIASGASQ